MVQLFGNGHGASSTLPCGHELDVFLAPTAANYAGSVEPMGLDYGIIQDPPPLSAHISLNFSFDALVSYASVGVSCSAGQPNAPCGSHGGVDYGGVVASLIAHNHTAGQVLFYQIYLYDTRQAGQAALNGCGGPDPGQDNTYWFDPGSTPFPGSVWYGVTDHIANYGMPRLDIDQAVSYTLNVLPALAQSITEGPSSPNTAVPALDSNLSHWQVTELYVGTMLQGNAELVSVFSAIDLVGQGYW
jgi:hypothetical protein